MEVYSLEAAVQAFFGTQTSPTRQESDKLASALLGGGPVVPFAIQGQFSYTVFSPERIKASEPDHAESSDKYSNAKIVQFRLPESKINICLAQCAKEIHGHLAAETYYHGDIGHSTHRLAIYVIEKLSGVAYIEMGNFSAKMDPDRAMRQFRMIEDFASFLATCWLHPQHVPQRQQEDTRTLITHKISLLASALPSRFNSIVSRLQRDLHHVFSPWLPQVLTHGDLSPTNILVSATTGRITGIIDWAEAEVLPFGLALYGLENLLGYMGPWGWRYFQIRNELECKFWERFWALIDVGEVTAESKIKASVRTARTTGILLRYGFEWENGTLERAVTGKDVSSLAYLDAFLGTSAE